MPTPHQVDAALFARVTPPDEEKYRTCVPLLTLKAAAGAFSPPQHVEDDDWEWIVVDTKHRQPAIPDGAYCLFAGPVTGTRQGKTVLVQLRDATDPETASSPSCSPARTRARSNFEGAWWSPRDVVLWRGAALS